MTRLSFSKEMRTRIHLRFRRDEAPEDRERYQDRKQGPLSSPAGILMTVEPIKREGVRKGT